MACLVQQPLGVAPGGCRAQQRSSAAASVPALRTHARRAAPSNISCSSSSTVGTCSSSSCSSSSSSSPVRAPARQQQPRQLLHSTCCRALPEQQRSPLQQSSSSQDEEHHINQEEWDLSYWHYQPWWLQPPVIVGFGVLFVLASLALDDEELGKTAVLSAGPVALYLFIFLFVLPRRFKRFAVEYIETHPEAEAAALEHQAQQIQEILHEHQQEAAAAAAAHEEDEQRQ